MPMRHARSALLVALVAALGGAARAEPARPPADGDKLFDAFELRGRKDPITVTADTLEYDYKKNVVVYHGDVQAAQGPVRLRADALTVTLRTQKDDPATPEPAHADDARHAAPADPLDQGQRVDQIVAVGNVRIDHGSRWATGGRAVFDQTARTLVLSETPVLHDGSNEVAGDRVVVYLDEDRSVVEGGRRRVKAVLYPGSDGGLARPSPPAAATPGTTGP
jgi:lipopolysaccharide export system protein LptA